MMTTTNFSDVLASNNFNAMQREEIASHRSGAADADDREKLDELE
jgi:hypothetical protein